MSVGRYSLGTCAPNGILKLSNILKDSKTASTDVANGRQEAVKAAAHTNREGAVKSPGKPINPEPPPNGFSFSPSKLIGLFGLVDKLR